MQSQALKPYMDLMSGPDVRTILVVLDGLGNLLRVRIIHLCLSYSCFIFLENFFLNAYFYNSASRITRGFG